ncbi:MAG: hypothetical protein JNK15_04140 [Planctomycetes bacterium]|nr:hypothetical protein [Planctomycetota bacterium]
MRTLLLVPFLTLLPALTAQAPTPRPVAETYPPAEEAVAKAPDDLTPTERDALARSLGARPQSRVLFDQTQADGTLWAIGTAWKASFDATGFTAIPFFGSQAPRNFPVRFELTQATVGGTALPLADGVPAVRGNQVRTARGGCTEVIDLALDQMEQSFVFDALPNRGAIAVDVRVDTELAASMLANGIRFGNEFGHVDYQKAVAVDAAGRRLPLAIEWTGNGVHMEIPASFVEQAQLPLVLDPVLNYWYGIASGQAVLQHDSDVASFQSLGGRTLIVYQRDFSAGDTDCWGVLFDGNLGLVQTDFTIDFTNANWKNVAVAAHNYSQNFLVVAEVETVLSWFIVGRTVAANAVVGAQFDIERDGVVGVPGNSFSPDVGSDPYYGPGRYTVVFMKRPNIFSNAQTIYYKQVNPAGTLVTTAPVLVDTNAQGVDRPSISKSCGQSNGQPAFWLLTWQRTWVGLSGDQEVWGRFVNWNGAIQGTSPFAIAFTPAEETAPSSGSPIDVNGTRYWPMCHEYATALGQPRDVNAKLLNSSGGTVAGFTVNTPVPGEDDREPEIDSDGTRFVVTRTNGTGVEAVTAAYLAASNTFRVEERTALITSGLDTYGETNICADYSGGGSMSPRYFLSFSEQSSNTFRLEVFGGWLPGQFFVPQTNPGGVTTMAVTGSPVIGQTVGFDVQPGPLAAVHIGTPNYIPLNALGCNCVQGVDPVATFLSPWSWTIPNNVVFVGLQFAAQGFHLTGTQCLGFIDLSQSVNFTIR